MNIHTCMYLFINLPSLVGGRAVKNAMLCLFVHCVMPNTARSIWGSMNLPGIIPFLSHAVLMTLCFCGCTFCLGVLLLLVINGSSTEWLLCLWIRRNDCPVNTIELAVPFVNTTEWLLCMWMLYRMTALFVHIHSVVDSGAKSSFRSALLINCSIVILNFCTSMTSIMQTTSS